MQARHVVSVSTLALLLAACSPASQGDRQSAPAGPSRVPTQAELDRLKAEGPLPAAREASKLEFWLHYKLMQATGMEQALGGEDKAIAALKAVSLGFERSAIVAQTQMPRMVPAAFDGTGIDAGMMGAGYGLVGGAITGGMMSGIGSRWSNEQIAEAAKHGPIKFDDKDVSMQVDIAQDGLETTLEQTVNEDGVTGKVKTHVHLDACPDAEGKLVVTLETESKMSVGGKSGAVTLRYRQERFLDDDAQLLPIGDGDNANAAEFFQIDMQGNGANGDVSYYEDSGFTRDGKAAAGTQRYSGYSIFRPEENRATEKMVAGSENLMRAFAQLMLDGTLGSKLIGGNAPWESGRCVDLKLRSSPEKRKGAKPSTAYTLFAEPRAKKDGMPTGGTVKATLNGEHTLNPKDKAKADAQFDYANPEKKDQSASIDFEARSKRGVGKATLEFDTKKKGYLVTPTGSGACNEPYKVCDLDKPVTVHVCQYLTLTQTPTGDKSGTYSMHFAGGGGTVDASGTYALSGPEERMTATYTTPSACGHAGGRTVCTPARTGTAIWTQTDDCDE